MKLHVSLICLLLALHVVSVAQKVGIGTTTPNNSAILDIQSTTKGLLIPRMTSAQRGAIPSPATGLMVYDTNTKTTWTYNGTQWVNSASGTGFALPYDGTTDTPSAAFVIHNSGGAIEGLSTSGIGVYASSTSGNGVYASSANNYAISATSINSGALYAYNNNIAPAILAQNTGGQGFAIDASSSAFHAIRGTSAAISKYGVWGDATGPSGVGVFGSASSNTGYGVYGSSNAGTGVNAFSSSGTALRGYSGSGFGLEVIGNIKIHGGNTNPTQGAVLTCDATGTAVWKNNRIGFKAYDIANQYTSISQGFEAKVVYQSEEYDYGNTFAVYPANSEFVAPKTGVYHLDVGVNLYIWDANFTFGVTKIKRRRNGVTETLYEQLTNNAIEGSTESFISQDFKLQAGDALWITVTQYNDENASASIAEGYFDCHLLFED